MNSLNEKEQESHFIRNIFKQDESDEDDSLFSPITLDFSPSPDKKSPLSPSADNKTSTLHQDDEFGIFTPPADTSIMLCTFQTDNNAYDPMTRTCCNNNNLIGLDCGVPARALGGSAQPNVNYSIASWIGGPRQSSSELCTPWLIQLSMKKM